MQSDPIGLSGGLNTFLYVGGNTINNIDPFGLTACDVAVSLAFVRSKFPKLDVPDTVTRGVKNNTPGDPLGQTDFDGNISLHEEFYGKLGDSGADLLLSTTLHEVLHRNQNDLEQLLDFWTDDAYGGLHDKVRSMISIEMQNQFNKKRKEECCE